MTGLREWASLYLKGVAMGSADAVPGVSGGTIALIVGDLRAADRGGHGRRPRAHPTPARRRTSGQHSGRAGRVPRDRRRLPVRPPRWHRNRGRRRSQRRRLPARNASRRDLRLLLRVDRGLCGGAFGGVSLDVARRKAAAIAGSLARLPRVVDTHRRRFRARRRSCSSPARSRSAR